MNVVLDELIEFCNFFRYIVEIINTDILVRHNILSFNNILCCCMYINGNSWSYSLTNIIMRMRILVRRELEKIWLGLLQTPLTYNPNRHYKRIRIKPIGKWYFCVKHEERIDQ
jgi:hypothetical protein